MTSILTIEYENGSTDTFAVQNKTEPKTSGTKNTSDDELLRMAENMQTNTKSDSKTDADPLRMHKAISASSLTPYQLRSKAKKYKKIGLIGGCSILVMGTIVGTALSISTDEYFSGGNYIEESYFDGAILGVALGGSALIGTLWYVGFNSKANSYLKKAREIELYTSSIVEDEILHFGDSSLMAGINLMGNRFTRIQTLGVSFKLNF